MNKTIFQVVHGSATALHQSGLIEKNEMDEFDDMCQRKTQWDLNKSHDDPEKGDGRT